MSILHQLLYRGQYDHIILGVLQYVSANDIASLQRVDTDWRKFIEQRVWGNKLVKRQMRRVWGSFMPTTSIKTNKTKVLCMQCDGKYLICGEGHSGKIVIYRRSDFNFSWEGYMKIDGESTSGVPLVLGSAHKTNTARAEEGDHITPVRIVKAHPTGEDVTCLDFNEVLLVSGSSSGSLKLFNLETSELVGNLSLGSWTVAIHQVKLSGGLVVATAGCKVTVQVCKNLEEKMEVGLRLQFIYRFMDLFYLTISLTEVFNFLHCPLFVFSNLKSNCSHFRQEQRI